MDAQETRIYTTAIILVIVISSIVVYFIISIIRQQRKNLELNKQLVFAEIAAIEKDRLRIAFDLHDELGSMLSSIKLKINIFELTNVDDKIQIEKINDHIDKGLNRIREISYNLMPAVLINSGLAKGLKDYINTINSDNLNIDLIFPDYIKFNEQQSINIFRIVQEVINNCLKHSKANHLGIIFMKEKSKILISMKDNGIGFKINERYNKGIGLKSLHSRSQLLNGKMYLESQSGAGTEFIFEIPC